MGHLPNQRREAPRHADTPRRGRCWATFGALVVASACVPPQLPEPVVTSVDPQRVWNGADIPVEITGANFLPQIDVDAGGYGTDLDNQWQVDLVGPSGGGSLAGVTVEDARHLLGVVPAGLVAGDYWLELTGPGGQFVASDEALLEVSDNQEVGLQVAYYDDPTTYSAGERVRLLFEAVGFDSERVVTDVPVQVTLTGASVELVHTEGFEAVDSLPLNEGVGFVGVLPDGQAILPVELLAPGRLDVVARSAGGPTLQQGTLTLFVEGGSKLPAEIRLPGDAFEAQAGVPFSVMVTLYEIDGVTVLEEPVEIELTNACGTFSERYLVQGPTAVEVEVTKVTQGTNCAEDAITVSDGAVGSSEGFEVVGGPPNQLRVFAVPGEARAGAPLALFIVAQDGEGNVTPFDGSSVTVSDDLDSLQVTACDAAEQAVSCTVVGTVASDDIQVTVDAGGGLEGTYDGLVITAGEETGELVVAHPSDVRAGEPAEVGVQPLDLYGNPQDPSEVGADEVVLTDELGDVVCVPTDIDALAGVQHFDCTFTVARDDAVVSATGLGAVGTTSAFDIDNGVVGEVTLGVPAAVEAGDSFSLLVQAFDAFGNPYLRQDDPVIDLGDALDGLTVASVTLDAGGTATTSAALIRAGTTTIEAGQGGVVLGVSSPIDVSSGPTDGLAVSVAEPWAYVGTSVPLTVQSVDEFGNRTSVTGTVTVSSQQTSTPDLQLGMVNGLAASSYTWDEQALNEVLDAITDSPHSLTDLYLMSEVHGWLRPVVLELARQLPLRPPAFRVLRRLLKAAEMLPDAELFGVLAHRIETTPPMYTSPYWGTQVYRPGMGRVSVSDPRLAFSSASKVWWRRRLWRTLRRLGEAGAHDEYTELATGLLLAVTDDDGRTPQVVTRYDYWQRKTVRVRATAPFSHLWALSHVLYADSPRFAPQKRSLTMPCAPSATADTPATGREEAFGAAWEAHPERLAQLLAASRCEPVHELAAGVLRALPERWSEVPTAELLRWFEAPYDATRALAAELAVARYDPHDPDKSLVLALLGCADAEARATARGWVEANPTAFLADLDFLTAVALHPVAEARKVATDLLAGTALSTEASAAFVARALEAARGLHDANATEVLRDLAALLLTAFARELRALPLDEVTALVGSGVEGAAELGAKVLLQHDVRPVDLPDTLLADVMTSPFAVVRGIGVRLFGELPDAVIAQRMAVVVHLCTSEHADLRSVVRPIVRRMAAAQPAFAAAVLRALLPVLTQPSDDEGLHRDLATLVRDDLAPAHGALTTEQILALTRASSTAIQELGGQLLRAQVDPSDLSLEQLATVACADVLAVREGAFHLLRARGGEAAANADALLPLFDAAWEGTRQFGMELFEEHVVSEGIDPDLLVALCDSMRPDVQAFGRRSITRLFDASHGRALLQRLAEHPAPEMQTFASTWLPSYAADDPRFLAELETFFVQALSQVSRGRATKTRLFAFLHQEATASEEGAAIVARVLGRVSVTISIEDRARCVATLTAIAERWPAVDVPLTVVAPPVRRRATRSDHAV